jgi:hypothetical protein
VLRLRGTVPRSADGWNVMVDMFFYRDPEEVENQQREEAAAKAAAAGGDVTADAAPGDWDVSAAPTAGGINPALATGEGGACLRKFIADLMSYVICQVSIGLQSPLLVRTGQLSQPRVPGARTTPTRSSPADGINCILLMYSSLLAFHLYCILLANAQKKCIFQFLKWDWIIDDKCIISITHDCNNRQYPK